MIKQLNGERKNMLNQKKIDEVAIRWNKTKDPKDKELWYKLIKEFANGPHNIKRRPIPTNFSYKTDNGWNSIDK